MTSCVGQQLFSVTFSCYSCFFFLIIPRPPSSTLFPYTTLFRSSGGGSITAGMAIHDTMKHIRPDVLHRVVDGHRSEEHTSELQSRPHLVCRLLLEKKKKKENRNRQRHTRNQYSVRAIKTS